jgi:hypothetical protein
MLWMNFAVRAGFPWPNTVVEIPFEGSTAVLTPANNDLACTASLYNANGFNFEAGATKLSRFLSRLAWSKRGGIEEHFAVGTNDSQGPGRLGHSTFATSSWANVDPWHQLYMPCAYTERASLGLALFREGMTLNSAPLSFLSFFKIVNVLFPDGRQQKAWLNKNLGAVKYGKEFDRLKEIEMGQTDIGGYLYKQGRCAVAHAYGSPVADPDNYADRSRLRDDLPLIKALAEHCIEQELGVPTTSSFLMAHRNSPTLPPEYLVPREAANGRIRYEPFSGDA